VLIYFNKVLYISFNRLAVSFSRYLIDIGNSYTQQISSFHNTHGVFKLKWLTSLMLTCVKLWKSHCTEARTELGSKRVDKGDGTYTATYTAANTTGTAKITALTNIGQFATATIDLLEIHLSLSTPANQIEAGATMDLTLTVKDSKGNVVVDETVELTADQGTVELTNEGGGSYKVKGLEPFMSYYYLLRYYSCLGPQN